MSGRESTRRGSGEPEVDLGPLRKIHEIASKVLKLGKRWLSAQFAALPGDLAAKAPFDKTGLLLSTFMEANAEGLFGLRARYLTSEGIRALITSNRPLSDAIDYLEYASLAIFNANFDVSVVETAMAAIKTLEVARNIFGEVLDDLEAEENPTLIPVWGRAAKQLWYGEILCREYRKVAVAQFEILDLFQNREWPKTVPSPWRDEKKLRDTIGHMNEAHSSDSPIRFEIFNMKPSWFRYRPRSGPDQLR